MKASNPPGALAGRTGRPISGIVFAGLLTLIFAILFFKSFTSTGVVFSNDGPLGAMVATQNRMPAILTGLWTDLNWLGGESPAPSPSISSAMRLVTSPLGFAKFLCPVALFILGLCAWFCFRQWRLAPAACALGGFAAALSSHYLSTACWGVAAQVIAVGMNFVAVGLLGNALRTRSWIKVVLAGMAVGMGIMEGYDIGAMFSLFVAAFVVFQALTDIGEPKAKIGRGIIKLAIVAIFAGFLAAQALLTLVGTQIKGVASGTETPEAKQQNWDFVTQWSFPPSEILQMVSAGVYGYRMDTPKNMEVMGHAFQGGTYWGEIGRDPGLDRALKAYEASGKQGQHPEGGWRFSGGGEYASVLTVLIALWAVTQSFRKKSQIFTLQEKKIIWFWSAAALVSLLLSFGRYAPFYRLWYLLPYASTIRNATKFTHTFHWCLVILFAYGVHSLCKYFLEGANTKTSLGLGAHLKNWWAKADLADKRWVRASAIVVGVGFVAWLIYGSSRSDLVRHLQEVGFADPGTAGTIASFSINSLGWSVVITALAATLILLIVSGWFKGARARTGAILIGAFLIIDLARANLPWILYWNYPYKYATNPVLDLLKDRPYSHRVAIFPLERFMRFDQLPPEARPLAEAYFRLYNLYHMEWKQQQFPYHNIQNLDVIQMPRQPIDYLAFERATGSNPLRHWQLTNTRYLLGPTALLQTFNQQLDSQRHRFRVAAAFDIIPKPGAADPNQPENLTAVLNTNGEYAVFEFTGALPRASLYSNWQVNTNDETALSQLASPGFDPAKLVLVSSPISASASTSTNGAAGTVEYESYAPKDIVLRAKAGAPSILLLNDKHDANWKVWVDGSPQPLLRCNYIMRGVQVPAGDHKVEFKFLPSITGLYVSLVAIAVGFVLIGVLVVSRKSDETPDTVRIAA